MRLLIVVGLVACSSRARAPAEAAPADAAVPLDAAAPPAPPPVRAIGVGEHLSCALLESGEVRCWGATRLTAAPLATTPVAVGIGDGVSLGVGTSHVCVARAGGSVWCWGDNRDGAVGDGTTIDRGVPTEVPGLADIVEVVAGGVQSCARDRAGAVWCWGHSGAVGHDAKLPAISPARVAGLRAATHLVAGDDITCALVDGAAPRCWGFNTSLLLGDISGPALRAIASPPLAQAIVFGLGYRTACLAQADGTVYCGGDDHFGELGDQRVPDDAQCDPWTPDQRVSCTWTDPEPPRYVPAPGEPPPPDIWPPPSRPPPERHTKIFTARLNFVYAGVSHPIALAGAAARNCAIRDGGDVWCWGQMYAGSMEWSHRIARAIPGVEHAVALAVSHEHACALLADHTVRCWGYDTVGELGDGRATRDLGVPPSAAPVRW